MGEQNSKARCPSHTVDDGQVRSMNGKQRKPGVQWLRRMVLLLLPSAAILMSVMPGLRTGLNHNHAGCPSSTLQGLERLKHDASPSVHGQDSCCTGVPPILRSGECHCSKGGRFISGNTVGLLSRPSSEAAAARPGKRVGHGARLWDRDEQEQCSSSFRSFLPPVSSVLSMVRFTVLLI